MGKLAPRLLFFQYSNKVSQEIDPEKRKYRSFYLRSIAEMEINRLRTRKFEDPAVGLSTVKDDSTYNSSEVSIFDVQEQSDFSDTETVFSSYFEDERDQF